MKPTQPATTLPAPEVEVLDAVAPVPVAVLPLLVPLEDAVPEAVEDESAPVAVAVAVPVAEPVPFTWLAPVGASEEEEEEEEMSVVAGAEEILERVTVLVGATVPVDEEVVLDAVDAAEDEEDEEVEPSVMLNWFCWTVSAWTLYFSLLSFFLSPSLLSSLFSLSLLFPPSGSTRHLPTGRRSAPSRCRW